MAKNKIERIDQEITKVREKIAEYQETSSPKLPDRIVPIPFFSKFFALS